MKSIRLQTTIPGPRSEELQRTREKAIPRGLHQATPIYVARAEGALIEDVDGNRFIDLAGGIGCLNTGHRPAAVASAVQRQMDRFMHVCAQVTLHESYIELAEALNRLAPGRFPKRTLLVNSGAEAVENAVKIARAYTKRSAILCFQDAFHGRTAMGMALTSKTHPYKAGFEPLPGEVYRLPYAYCYRCSYGKTFPECGLFCGSNAVEDVFRRLVAAEDVAAVIFEPVQGEGGFVVPPPGFLARLAATCANYGIVVIADEVQSGMARTGTMFACERLGVEPDILITAKSLGGGLPLGAITGRAEIMDAPGPGALGTTFGGNPVSCAAALAALKLIEEQNLCARASELGVRFERRARQWQKRWALIGDIRGLGAMYAIELVRIGDGRVPADLETRRVISYCHERGVIVISAGSFGNVIRLLMPLVITDEQFDEALDVMESAFECVSRVEAGVQS